MIYNPHEIADIFPLIQGKEFADLKADIKANGLHEDIILYEDRILDGRNRFKACQEVGVQPRFTRYTGADPVGYVLSLNLHRRHLSESQRAMVGANIANLEIGANQHLGSANLQTHNTRAEAAAKLNVSERSVNTAKKVQREGSEELIDAVQEGKVSVSAAADVATLPEVEQVEVVAKGEKAILQAAKDIRAKKAANRRAERIEKIADISAGNIELKTEKKYPVIYADPPWRYDYAETDSRKIENQYPTMSLEEICALEVPATEDAILFMWTTAPKLEESMRVIGEWGFTYRSCAIWDKEKMGMGYYFRIQHEILMIATKGSIPTPEAANRPRSVIQSTRGEHSSKPAIFAEIIEDMYEGLPKIELFCREPREGWDVWGNQSDCA